MDTLRRHLTALDATGPDYARQFVDALLNAARSTGVSDVHLQPTPAGLELRWRLDGVLQPVGTFPRGESADVVARLKVLAELLTYRTDVPQEGRLREPGATETRVSTFPTLHGERAVVRFFASAGRFLVLPDLGLPDDVTAGLQRLLAETSGAFVIAGPAGSGKTTTAYACLREIVGASSGGRCVVSLEDPIEVAVAGVSQSQVHDAAGFTLATGLRSLMRQDPEVIFVGEIRDRATAEIVFQASLTGHLVVTTMHAGSAVGAITRLLDMEIEPYLLRSGLRGVLGQRLVRRLCSCASEGTADDARLGLPVARWRQSAGCPSCWGTGYRGRAVLAEFWMPAHNDAAGSVLARGPAGGRETVAAEAGLVTRWERARAAVETGATSPAEVRRVLGFDDDTHRGTTDGRD